MTQEQTDLISSHSEAKTFWHEEYGGPEFFREEDVPDVESALCDLENELKTIEAQIQSRDNNSHYKLNRAIVLHFIVTAGNEYLDEIHALVYEGVYEAELEHLNSIETKQHPWEII